MGSQSHSPVAAEINPTVVLGSYQGAAFIDEQIASLQDQSHSGWRLLVRDDGSSDETVSRVRRRAEHDPRIDLVDDGLGRLGVVGNFSRLLELAWQDGAEWIALCDQDDRWLPTKLEKLIARALRLGAGAGEPVLVHSDLAVVGPQLEPIHDSLHGLMGLRHEARTPLATLLVQNFVTGCSCLVNRALLEIALPIPQECVMYDWWLALCAAAGGRLGFEAEPTVLYRQHAGNVVGAAPLRDALRGALARSLSWRRHDPTEFVATLEQAAALERRLRARASCSRTRSERLLASSGFVSDYLDLYRDGGSRIRRVLELHRRRIRRQKPILDASLKLRLLTGAVDFAPPPPPPNSSPSLDPESPLDPAR